MTRRLGIVVAVIGTVLAASGALAPVNAGVVDATADAIARSPVTWAPESTATIHPGVQTITDGGQCTANFVFYDDTDVYIGQAAHCAGLGGSTDTNGCEAGSLPLGTEVTVRGATRSGTLAYSSWHTMIARGETDPSLCYGNDFALIRLHRSDHARVNPTVPYWGGPHGVAEDPYLGSTVYSYGNSGLRFGLWPLSPKAGVAVTYSNDRWTNNVYTVSPGIPGDSGSAFVDGRGAALGVLSTLQLLPLTGSNGVSNLARALDYMEANTSLDVTLANGTRPFSPL